MILQMTVANYDTSQMYNFSPISFKLLTETTMALVHPVVRDDVAQHSPLLRMQQPPE